MTYQGFGNGSSGAATLSGTDAPVDSSCSGTSGTKSLLATNASFASEKLLLIHQSRGTGCGNWEINIVDSYSTGTITTLFDLVNTYTDSGNSQAQVIQLPEYSQVTVSGTLTAKAWDGNVGGIIAFLCNGDTTVSGTITAKGRGFRGGQGTRTGSPSQWGIAGEGDTASYTGLGNTSNNGSGGGAGNYDGGNRAAGGGGGSHSVIGDDGVDVGGGNFGGGYQAGVGGTGGQDITGTSTLSTMTFGGGGGSSVWATGSNSSCIDGGNGGGIVFILTSSIVVTGSINVDGDKGIDGVDSSNRFGGSGSGAGGSIYIVAIQATIGTNLLSANGGVATASGSGLIGGGGKGANGRIYISTCSLSGTTNQGSFNNDVGGQDFCQSFISIY